MVIQFGLSNSSDYPIITDFPSIKIVQKVILASNGKKRRDLQIANCNMNRMKASFLQPFLFHVNKYKIKLLSSTIKMSTVPIIS